MVTKTNFKNLLKTLGFTEEGNAFQKSIREADLKKIRFHRPKFNGKFLMNVKQWIRGPTKPNEPLPQPNKKLRKKCRQLKILIMK